MIRTRVEQSLFVPGLGHPVHKDGDPRTPVLSRIASETACGSSRPSTGYIRSFWVGDCQSTEPESAEQRLRTSASPPHLTRGVSLVARSAGLLGHIAEELRSPIGQQVYNAVDRNAEYSPPRE